MAHIHHIAITVRNTNDSAERYKDLFEVLAYKLNFVNEKVAVWVGNGPEILLYSARHDGDSPHVFGTIGWQHLAFSVESTELVDEAFGVATKAGWTIVRSPKLYPRFADGYYATYIEDPDGIRFEISFIPETSDE